MWRGPRERHPDALYDACEARRRSLIPLLINGNFGRRGSHGATWNNRTLVGIHYGD
jgi:hypothetical protein